MADGCIERVGMALSCGGRLRVISGCMHNLADWHKDTVAVITFSRRKKKQRIREDKKGGKGTASSKTTR
jgi:hypothetical protein